MSALSDLYQQVILDHNRQPCNFHKLEGANRSAEGYNPLCGDRLTLYVNLDGALIKDISFLGSGCAISKASASMMTAALKGKSKDEAEVLFEKFHRMITGGGDGALDLDGLGKLAAFSGVSEFPIRVKCASLAWHALRAVLAENNAIISTE